jgi:hypothetical protein
MAAFYPSRRGGRRGAIGAAALFACFAGATWSLLVPPTSAAAANGGAGASAFATPVATPTVTAPSDVSPADFPAPPAATAQTNPAPAITPAPTATPAGSSTTGSTATATAATAAAAVAPPTPVASPAAASTGKKAAIPPEDPEVKEGREAHEEMVREGMKFVRDPAVLDRVERIGRKLAAVADVTQFPAGYGSSRLVPYDYHFYVIDDPDVNAFSMPGGYIYINKGLLNAVQSDDELACVIGHEITHAAHHHVVQLEKEQAKTNLEMGAALIAAIVAKMPAEDMGNALTGVQLLAIERVNGFGQNAERDADHGGIILAQKAGYNPVGMLTFMERLAREERMRPDIDEGIFRTHPPSQARADAATKELEDMGIPIDRRLVTNELKVAVRKVAIGGAADVVASEVTVDGKVIYRSRSTDRVQETADALDRALDDSLQIWDVTKQGNVVLAHGKPVVTVQPDDIQVPGNGSTPDAIADQAYHALRMALYNDLLENGT